MTIRAKNVYTWPSIQNQRRHREADVKQGDPIHLPIVINSCTLSGGAQPQPCPRGRQEPPRCPPRSGQARRGFMAERGVSCFLFLFYFLKEQDGVALSFPSPLPPLFPVLVLEPLFSPAGWKPPLPLQLPVCSQPAYLAVSQVTPLRQLEPVKLDPFISAELTDNQPSGFLGNKILAGNSESFPGHFQHGEWSGEALDWGGG